jgi:methyltransferase
MSALWLLVGFVVLQRLAELLYASSNTRRLFAEGAVEHGRGHYPLFILLHGAWLASLLIWIPKDQAPLPWLVVVFFILQGLRVWILLSLGPRWTTRIIVLPDAPLVRRGPYRFLKHPNYLVVTGEIAVLPLAFGAWQIALAFSLLNAALLAWRIRTEELALASARALPGTR